MTLPHRKVMEGNQDLQVSLSVIVRTFVRQTYKGKWIIKYTPIRTRIKLSWLRVQFYHWRLAWKACSMRFYHKSIKEQYKNNNSRIKSLLRIQIQLRLQMIFLLSEMILSILNIWLNLISRHLFSHRLIIMIFRYNHDTHGYDTLSQLRRLNWIVIICLMSH